MSDIRNRAKQALAGLNNLFNKSTPPENANDDVDQNNSDDVGEVFYIMYGTDKLEVTIEPGLTVAKAFKNHADELSFDPSRLVTYRTGATKVKGTDSPEAGRIYVAAVQHEQKG